VKKFVEKVVFTCLHAEEHAENTRKPLFLQKPLVPSSNPTSFWQPSISDIKPDPVFISAHFLFFEQVFGRKNK